MNANHSDKLRNLPAIGQLLEDARVADWLTTHPRQVVVDCLQRAVERRRDAVMQDADADASPDRVLEEAGQLLRAAGQPSLRRVINATGVVLHTGLGRAPLSEAAIQAIVETARTYANLELDLHTGERGKRASHVTDLLVELTGAEAATVVNNNAAATLLILHTVAREAEVIVSRGQLVEIGGSYRLPDVMAAGGARLREVGTTNRTRPADYERAVSDATAALMRVHTSNYRIVGFTEETSLAALVALGRQYGKLVIDDLGSGAMFDLAAAGLPDEPHVPASIEAGADLVCFSGDKLLGGPQAGIVVGRRDLIARIEASPLMRTYRVGKLTLAALEATLRAYRDRAHAIATIPAMAMLAADEPTLRRRAQQLTRRLRRALPEETFETVQAESVAGGGTLPARPVPTHAVAWQPAHLSAAQGQQTLRRQTPPVVARTQDNRILFDVRTIAEEDTADLVAAVSSSATAPPQ